MNNLPAIIERSLLEGRCVNPKYSRRIGRLRRFVERFISSEDRKVERAWRTLDKALSAYLSSSGKYIQHEYISTYGLTADLRYPPRWAKGDDADLFLSGLRAGSPELVKVRIRYTAVGCLALIALHDARAGRKIGFDSAYFTIENAYVGASRRDAERGRKVLNGSRSGQVGKNGTEQEREAKKTIIVDTFKRIEEAHPYIKSRSQLYELTSIELEANGTQAAGAKTVGRAVRAILSPKRKQIVGCPV